MAIEHANNERERQRLNDRLNEIDRRLQRLRDAHIYAEPHKRIDRATYETERNALNQARTAVEGELAELSSGCVDVSEIVAVAETFMSQAAVLWNQAISAEKRALQAHFFPGGVPYRDGAFGTAPTSIFFNYMGVLNGAGENVASPMGTVPSQRVPMTGFYDRAG